MFREAVARLIGSIRVDVNVSVSVGEADACVPQGDCFSVTERSDGYPVGFRVDPVE